MPKDPSRTEDPTAKRKKKAREKGQVPKSQELSKTLVLLAGIFMLYAYIGTISGSMKEIYTFFLSKKIYPFEDLNPANFRILFSDMVTRIAWIIMPPILVMAAVAFITLRLEVGHLWTFSPMSPKFDKIFNLAAALNKLMVDPQNFIRLGKSLLQAAILSIAPYMVLKDEIANIVPLYYMNADGLAAYILGLGFKMILYAAIPMILLAAADVFYTRWKYIDDMKMTKQEVKDEHKQMEGDPMVKQRQRKKMMEAMSARMMESVPKADVVVTNPTHYAIALRYNALEAPAPVVVAKGVDHIAQKIKEIAREHRVPIKENRPLARALYKQVELGDMIPEEMYQAVASILSQIRKAQQ